MKIGKIIYPKIFGCPECRKRFTSINGLNNHLTKSHDSKIKIDLIAKGRACTRRKLLAKGRIRK